MAKEEVQIKPMEEAKPSELANPEKDGKQRELPEMVQQETKCDNHQEKSGESISWSIRPERESRRRKPTQRYGIDVAMKIDEEKSEVR